MDSSQRLRHSLKSLSQVWLDCYDSIYTCFTRHYLQSESFSQNEALFESSDPSVRAVATVHGSSCTFSLNHAHHHVHLTIHCNLFSDWLDVMLWVLWTIQASSITNISVAVPRIIEFQFPPHVAINGKTVVSCSVESGSPPFHFEWLKDGLPLDKSGRISIGTADEISSVTFRQLDRQDVGNYTCVVSNREGKDAHTARLVMNCKLWSLMRFYRQHSLWK